MRRSAVAERFLLDPFEPAYCALGRDELQRRVDAGLRELADCCACPRDCHIDRMRNETKACFINVNFVTPEHVVPQILEAIAIAVDGGLRLPIVYNTSAYDSVASLRLLDRVVDNYMPDFKFWEPATARRLAKAVDYPERARDAITEMHRQVGPLRFGPDGLARRGVLVRHLVMPGQEAEAAAIFRWLAELSPDTYVNVMGQYRPAHLVGTPDRRGNARYAEVDRCLTGELRAAYAAARSAGLWRFDER